MNARLSSKVSVAFLAVVLLVGLAGSGCSSKRKGALGGDEFGAAGGPGIGEEGFGGSSSLSQFEETGTVAGSGGVYRDVLFGYDSFQLDSGGMEAVRQNAALLSSDSARRVEIEGHCDDRGSSEYNLALGAKRARAVKDALVGLGVGAGRLDTVSYGEELPLCRESTESCYAQNRRAHLVDR